MSDQDYIRKAVELADGWGDLELGFLSVRLSGPPETTPKRYRRLLDALAAQLVRQVDALEGTQVAITRSGCVCAGIAEQIGRRIERKHYAEITGPDRTMNTIKAIVDSGVLEAECAT